MSIIDHNTAVIIAQTAHNMVKKASDREQLVKGIKKVHKLYARPGVPSFTINPDTLIDPHAVADVLAKAIKCNLAEVRQTLSGKSIIVFKTTWQDLWSRFQPKKLYKL